MSGLTSIPFAPHYFISKSGDVFCDSTFRKGKQEGKLRRLKQTTHKHGYLRVALNINGKQKHFFVQILMLRVFVGNAPDGHEAAHLNGDPTKNNIDNLAWLTHLDNIHHKKIHGTELIGSNHPSAKLSEQDVISIRSMLSNPGITIVSIASKFNVTAANISRIKANVSWKHVDGHREYPASQKGRPKINKTAGGNRLKGAAK